MKDLFSSAKLPNNIEGPEMINHKDINLSGSPWFPKNLGEETEMSKSFFNETIREWFVGKVLEVYFEEGYFEAQLKDTRGVESRARFDIDMVFEDRLDIEQHLFPGAKFVFSVVTKDKRVKSLTQSSMKFTNPYISRRQLFLVDPILKD